jgi:hypothetical protein
MTAGKGSHGRVVADDAADDAADAAAVAAADAAAVAGIGVAEAVAPLLDRAAGRRGSAVATSRVAIIATW